MQDKIKEVRHTFIISKKNLTLLKGVAAYEDKDVKEVLNDAIGPYLEKKAKELKLPIPKE